MMPGPVPPAMSEGLQVTMRVLMIESVARQSGVSLAEARPVVERFFLEHYLDVITLDSMLGIINEAIDALGASRE